jgi:hypothetical protein
MGKRYLLKLKNEESIEGPAEAFFCNRYGIGVWSVDIAGKPFRKLYGTHQIDSFTEVPNKARVIGHEDWLVFALTDGGELIYIITECWSEWVDIEDRPETEQWAEIEAIVQRKLIWGVRSLNGCSWHSVRNEYIADGLSPAEADAEIYKLVKSLTAEVA